eukprot:2632711-Ditylum_brightwellii.AAC.1
MGSEGVEPFQRQSSQSLPLLLLMGHKTGSDRSRYGFRSKLGAGRTYATAWKENAHIVTESYVG